MAERMTREQIEAQAATWIERARQYQATVLAPQRAQAIAYYNGVMDDLPAPDGRSQMVSTDVRNTIRGQLPSLMRIFFGPERVVEFHPRRPDGEAAAQQATDYVDLVLREDNDGFREFYVWMKDALLGGMGVMTWWWDRTPATTTEELTGLLPEQVALLQQDERVLAFTVTAETPVQLDTGEQILTYDVRLQRIVAPGTAKFCAVPPEDVLFDPDAPSLERAVFVGRQAEYTRDELRAMGYADDVLDAAGTLGPLDQSEEDEARAPGGYTDPFGSDIARIRYVELYVTLDADGTGVASRQRLVLLGDATPTLVAMEPAPDLPFAVLVPDPTPHTLIGLGTGDLVRDLQRVKTAILRGTLDSLAFTLTPRTEIVNGQVNLQDVLNPEIGAVIRVDQPGMVREITHDFVGREGLALLQYIDEIRENATGISKASAGLDADALQSSTRAAVAATVSGAQQHLDLLARMFAETGIKRFFRGLLQLLIRHQDVERVVRLRGQWQTVNPRTWDSGMDVRVNVALGLGQPEEKLMGLQGVAAKQEQVLQMLGPANPLVSLAQLRTTYAKMIELLGWPNADAFFQPLTEQQAQQMAAAQAQQPPQPSPEELLAQAQLAVERMKAEKELALKERDLLVKEAELTLKREEMLRVDDRERDKMELQALLQQVEIESKATTALETKRLDAAIEDAKQATTLVGKELDHAQAVEAEQRQADRAAATPPAPPKRTRRVKVVRGEDGKISGAEIEEAEG